jgi:phage protein D
MNLDGFKPQVDKLKWIVEKATHSYSTSGLTMQLELEASI